MSNAYLFNRGCRTVKDSQEIFSSQRLQCDYLVDSSHDFPSDVAVLDETVVLLGRKKVDEEIVYAYEDYEPKDSEYLNGTKGSATYREIKEWVKSQHGLSVSSLYIAQVKEKCGLEKRENFNLGAEGHRVPTCPPEKEEAILSAFRHFHMI